MGIAENIEQIKKEIGDGEEEYELENTNFASIEDGITTDPVTTDPVDDGVLAQYTQEDPPRAEVILPTPSRARAPPTRTPTPLSASSDDRRRRPQQQDDFLEIYRLQMVQEAESRKQESESRKALVDSLGLIATSLASVLGKKKKRKRTINIDSSSSSSDDSL